jgi:hypothetical protein
VAQGQFLKTESQDQYQKRVAQGQFLKTGAEGHILENRANELVREDKAQRQVKTRERDYLNEEQVRENLGFKGGRSRPDLVTRRSSFGGSVWKGTDHKNLDVMVKINGKIVKRPEPKFEPVLPERTIPAKEVGEVESSTSVTNDKCELDVMPTSMWVSPNQNWTKPKIKL